MLRIVGILIFFLYWSALLPAQQFTCSGDLILAISPDADFSHFYNIEIEGNPGAILSFDQFSNNPGPYLNAIGYRRTDNFVYGIAPNSHDLFRLDALGNVSFLHHFNSFDDQKSYNAGAVTPDGKYLVVLSGQASSAPFRSLEIILIDLESTNYETTVTPITTLSGNAIYSLDIAFDPYTGELYGFDGNNGRLVTIQLFSGQVDDLTFPATGNISIMAALFFDAFGELYGYAKHLGQLGIKAFYHIDKNSGEQEFLLEGPLASASDGCSCPYRVELLKSVEPQITGGCTEVVYRFEVANASGITQTLVNFTDELPEGFQAVEVYGNTFGGQVTGLETNNIQINDMTILPGIDTFYVRVEIGNVVPGIHKNMARLSNLSFEIGSIEYSDDPMTLVMDDSTAVQVLETDIDVFDQELQLCPGDTLLLDGTIGQFIYEYSWSNGATGPVLEVTEGGIYELYAHNDCEPKTITFFVEEVSQGIAFDLGPELSLALGDMAILDPNITDTSELNFNWFSSETTALLCDNCPTLPITPFQNTTYFLAVTDQNGCVFLDSIQVNVEKNYQIYVPNGFSPNNDGINDFFRPFGKTGVIVEEFQVFDRWGGLMYSVDSIPLEDNFPGWDGMSNGAPVAAGVYVWRVRARFTDGFVREFSGSVTVVF